MYVRKLITAFFEHDPLHSWQEEGMSTNGSQPVLATHKLPAALNTGQEPHKDVM